MAGKKILKYTYQGSKNDFKLASDDAISRFVKDTGMIDPLYIFVKDNTLEIGLERGGHSGGHWYKADINEYNNETHFSGTIDYIDVSNRTKSQTVREKIGLIILAIWFFPLTILLMIVGLIKLVLGKLPSKVREDRLELFMTKYMGCKSSDFNIKYRD